jgi:hypothetical protein
LLESPATNDQVGSNSLSACQPEKHPVGAGRPSNRALTFSALGFPLTCIPGCPPRKNWNYPHPAATSRLALPFRFIEVDRDKVAAVIFKQGVNAYRVLPSQMAVYDRIG